MSEIIVKVNEEAISREQLDGAVSRYIVQLEEDEDSHWEPTKENLKYLKTETLNHLIERLLLLQKAKKLGVNIPDEAVTNTMEEMKSNFESLEDWKENLVALRIPEDKIFDEVKNDLLVERLIEKLTADIGEYTEADLKRYFDDNERLMKEPDLFDFYEVFAENADQAKAASEILNAGLGLAETEKKLGEKSLHFHSHNDIPAYQLPEEILNVLSDMKEGQVSAMESPDGGLLVYRLAKRVIGKKLEFENVKHKLGEYLVRAARNEIMDKTIQGEMESANIQYVDTAYLEA